MPTDTKELPDQLDVFPSDETRKVYLSKTQFVVLKTELSYGERKRLDLASFKGFKNEMGVFDLAYQRALLLAVYVVEWNLLNRAGRPLVIPESIEQRVTFFEGLNEKVGEAIAAEVDRIQANTAEAPAEDDSGNVVTAASSPASANGSEHVIEATSTSVAGPVGAGTN